MASDPLPALPVAPLAPALTRLRHALVPFIAQSKAQPPAVLAAEIDQLIGDFGRDGGPGERLRGQIVRRQSRTANWLAEWWDATYMVPRTPISMWVNYFFDLEGISLLFRQSLRPNKKVPARIPSSSPKAHINKGLSGVGSSGSVSGLVSSSSSSVIATSNSASAPGSSAAASLSSGSFEVGIQAQAASLCATAMLKFHVQLQAGTLKPDMLKGKELDMDSYRFMFGACRLPVEGGPDELELHCDELPCPAETPMPARPSHICVLCRGFLFEIEVMRPVDAAVVDEPSGDGYPERSQVLVPISAVELAGAMQAIIDECNVMRRDSRGPGIGVFTSEDRDRAAVMLSRIRSLWRINSMNLDRLHRSLFLVCLDDAAPTSAVERCAALLHGPADNRWFDKSLQLIVFPDGQCGLNGEHSKLDGLPVGRLADEMFKDVASWVKDSVNALDAAAAAASGSSVPGKPSRTSPRFRELPFRIDDDDFRREMGISRQNVLRHVAGFQLFPLHFQRFGLDQVKRLGVSPDAFVQLCLQLSYVRCYSRLASTYESAATKAFLLGRTEVMRPCTPECAVWVESMCAQKAVSDEERYRLLQAAGLAHVEYMRAASQGLGFDRLLFGMRCQATENGEALHPLLSHPVLADSSRWELSTSQLFSHTSSFSVGYGPATDQGFGVCYCPRKDSIWFQLSSLSKDRVSASEFAAVLSDTLVEVAALCARQVSPPASAL